MTKRLTDRLTDIQTDEQMSKTVNETEKQTDRLRQGSERMQLPVIQGALICILTALYY